MKATENICRDLLKNTLKLGRAQNEADEGEYS